MNAAASKPRAALIYEPVEFFAQHTPEQIAIDEGGAALNYAELAQAMRNLAAELLTGGAVTGDRVGLLIDNGIPAIAALLGILRADCAFVPVSPTFPAARAATIFGDAEPIAIVVTPETAGLLAEIAELLEPNILKNIKAIVIDLNFNGAKTEPAAKIEALQKHFTNVQMVFARNPEPVILDSAKATAKDLAYIMYTSGTTGTPKGVMVAHANVRAFIEWSIKYFDLQPTDRFSNHPRLTFDPCIFDIFAAFFVGGTVCPIINMGDLSFPAKFIRNRKITVWNSVPSIIGMLKQANQLTPDCFSPHLRIAIFCGEALLPEYARVWIETNPQIPIFNLYGPTETTVTVTAYRVPLDFNFLTRNIIPIGKANAGITSVLILDESGSPLPQGEAGRLLICGSQVAAGYWRRPDLTEKVFLPDPTKKDSSRMYDTGDIAKIDEHGDVVWLGRSDNQIKLMGRRVELGEIEAVIAKTRLVHEVCVVLLLPNGEPTLLAAAVPTLPLDKFDHSQVEEEILVQCDKFLPSYMVPRQVRFLHSLPKNFNGKIDRRGVASLLEGS